MHNYVLDECLSKAKDIWDKWFKCCGVLSILEKYETSIFESIYKKLKQNKTIASSYSIHLQCFNAMD